MNLNECLSVSYAKCVGLYNIIIAHIESTMLDNDDSLPFYFSLVKCNCGNGKVCRPLENLLNDGKPKDDKPFSEADQIEKTVEERDYSAIMAPLLLLLLQFSHMTSLFVGGALSH